MPRRIRTALLALLALLAVAGLAILLVAPVHAFLVERGWTAEDKFLKVLRRLLLIPLLLLLFFWTRPWRDGGPSSYGLLGGRARFGLGFLGYLATLLVGGLLLAWHFEAGWLAWEDGAAPGAAAGRALRWVAVGFLLALLEEWFFRGWLDRRLGRVLSPAAAVALGAGLYAAIHAFKPSRLDVDVTHDAAGALQGLLWWLGNLFDLAGFGPRFVGLFLFALLLLGLWRRTGTLWTPIGVHAAGVALLRAYGGVTERSDSPWWSGGKELLDGPVAWVLLGALAWAVWPRGSRASPSPPPRAPVPAGDPARPHEG